MPVVNEVKTECHPYPYGMQPVEPVKSCDLKEETMPMIERLQMLGRQTEMLACGLDNLHTRLFVGGDNAKNFDYDRGTGSADDAVNAIARLTDISLKILEDIHTKL